MRGGASFIALSSLCFLVAMTGCGGGGSGSSYVPPAGTGTKTGTSSQTSATATPSPYPQTNGATYVYAGTLTQTFVSYPEVVAPGTPSPEPTSVTVTDVTQQITIETNQAFNGGSGLTDYHDAETDALASGLKTTTSTTDTYETIAQSGSSSELLDYGSQYADESGDTMTTQWQPQRVEDELPEATGTKWSNGAGASIQEAIAGDSSGSPVTVQRTIANIGTYTEDTTYPQGYEAVGYTGVGTIQENSDGSGSYAWVTEGEPITIEYSAPVPQPTGSPQITVAEFPNLLPPPDETPSESFELGAWYGVSPAFYNESDVDLGSIAVPASCSLSSSLPQTAQAIQETTNTLDTVIGYTETTTQTTYVAAGYGPVCTVLSDQQQLYYDFNGDQAFAFATLTPLEITTTAETLALQPGSSTSVSARSRVATSSLAPALRAHFERAVEQVRRRNVQTIARLLATHTFGAKK
jgi:hypothetical protein